MSEALMSGVQNFLMEDFYAFETPSLCPPQADLYMHMWVWFVKKKACQWEIRSENRLLCQAANVISSHGSWGLVQEWGCMVDWYCHISAVGWLIQTSQTSQLTKHSKKRSTHPHTFHSRPAWWCRRHSPHCPPGCQTWHHSCRSDRIRKPAPLFSGKQSLLEDNN